MYAKLLSLLFAFSRRNYHSVTLPAFIFSFCSVVLTLAQVYVYAFFPLSFLKKPRMHIQD